MNQWERALQGLDIFILQKKIKKGGGCFGNIGLSGRKAKRGKAPYLHSFNKRISTKWYYTYNHDVIHTKLILFTFPILYHALIVK